MATRVVDFSASASSIMSDNLVISASQPECRIMIVNAGSTSQTVTITLNVLTTGSYPNSNASYPAVSVGGTFGGSTFSTGAANTYTGTSYTDTRTLTATSANAAQDSVTYSWLPYLLPATTALTQDIKCYGTIKVDDATAGKSGFVTASGELTTFMESAPGAGLGGGGGTSKTVTTTPNSTVIMIGEGRPF